MTVTTGGTVPFLLTAVDGNGTIVGSTSGNISGGVKTQANGSFNLGKPKKNPIRVMVVIEGVLVGNLLGDNPCVPASGVGTSVNGEPPPPKFFDPGDSRLDPRPGDRLAVYCNPPDTLVVYGISSIGKGFLLTTFSHSALLAAGPAGLKKTLGDGNTVWVSEDLTYHFWISWTGGEYNATGQGDFAKGSTCAPRIAETAQRTLADGRVSASATDRLAVYCDLPDWLVVWGINNQGQGFLLGIFSNKALGDAGPYGQYINRGVDGVVSAMRDSQGYFWVAWNGGQYGADGQPKNGFAKGFRCTFGQDIR
ncbi:MAG: hypothetical protein IT324_05055 [Anaerolineae bacterium]|nr:hypothetical protein [Anaerolineae bacterium]